MEKISLEYCHVSPGTYDIGGHDAKRIISDNNKWMPKIMEMFGKEKVQKCIMIDDIHSTVEITDKIINKILEKLKIKPDCVYLESSFFKQANEMIQNIDKTQRDIIHSGERTFIRESLEKYRSVIEFLISWKKRGGEKRFSCPTLAAASYLYRLGVIKGDVKPIQGEPLIVSDRVVNVLSSSNLLVEDKAQSLIEATYKDTLRKISWFFY